MFGERHCFCWLIILRRSRKKPYDIRWCEKQKKTFKGKFLLNNMRFFSKFWIVLKRFTHYFISYFISFFYLFPKCIPVILFELGEIFLLNMLCLTDSVWFSFSWFNLVILFITVKYTPTCAEDHLPRETTFSSSQVLSVRYFDDTRFFHINCKCIAFWMQ